MFLNVFVINASSAIKSGTHDKASSLYKDLGEAWYGTEQKLAGMTTAEGAHVPAEDSTVETHCKFAMEHSLGLLWQIHTPKIQVRRVPLQMPALEVACQTCVTAASAEAAYDKWAAANHSTRRPRRLRSPARCPRDRS